jgi:hypothetical protein
MYFVNSRKSCVQIWELSRLKLELQIFSFGLKLNFSVSPRPR